MTGPRLPRVRAKTDEEKAADARWATLTARAQEARARIDARDESPFELVADALMDTVADAVFASISSVEFAAALAARGFTVAPVLPEGDTPGPTHEWMSDGVGLLGYEGDPQEPLDRLTDLYERAFRDGWSARAARAEG